MRAALLQLPGNPFILAYWLRNHAEVWKDEVDELRVFVNGCKDATVLEIDRRLVEDAGGVFTHQAGRLIHGQATQVLLDCCSADEVMLVEDDAFVRHAGAVDYAFAYAENDCVVGSPRGGMSPEVEQAARDKWGPEPMGPDGSYGYGLWPCFLFGQRKVLAPVLHGFPSRSWKAGETIPGLGRSFDREMTTDTFTVSAFLLRESADLVYEGQWKELWLRDLPEMQYAAGYDPPWFHAGGLSNEDYFNSGGGALGARAGIGGSNEGNDWAHRIWWLRRCVTANAALHPDLAAHYHRSLDELTGFCGVEREVEAWGPVEEPWVTWDDGTT